MTVLRVIVALFSLVTVAAAIVTGPVIGLTDQPSAEDSVDVTVESVPTDNIALEQGRFNSGRYHLEAPPAVVTVENVTGTPMLRYTIDIPAAEITRVSRYDLAGREGRLRMGVSPLTISPDRVDQDSYEARVSVWLRTENRDQRIILREATVEVRS